MAIGNAISGYQTPSGVVTTQTLPNDISYSDNGGVDKTIKSNNTEIKGLERMIEGTGLMVKMNDGEEAFNIVTKPDAWHSDRDKMLMGYNPNLADISKKIDDARQKIEELKQQNVNLGTAQEQMYGSLDNAATNINDSRDTQLKNIGLQKDIQIGAAQGLAGKSGATTGMLANVNTEIANKYAPQSLAIESAADDKLSQIEIEKGNIPGKLSALGAQNITNEYNKAKMQELMNQYKAKVTTSVTPIGDLVDNDELKNKKILDAIKNKKILDAIKSGKNIRPVIPSGSTVGAGDVQQ